MASPGARSVPAPPRAEAVVDLDAVTANTRALLARARQARPDVAVMAVVKAEGYGHGAAACARAALAGGATWLGVATLAEAVALRAAGLTAPLLAWLWVPGDDLAGAVAADVQIAVSGPVQLDALLAAVGDTRPRIHVKVDTGLGRNGVGPAELAATVDAVAAAQRAGRVEFVGLMSHLAGADVPGDPSVAEQTALFRAAERTFVAAGLAPAVRHLANTAATLDHPDCVFDLVRCGIGLYGLDPTEPGATPRLPLVPAMTLRATVAQVKRVPAGWGVSYGLTYRTTTETTLALVPLGYADGIPRAASSVGPVLLGGRRRQIAGRVAMDQFVVDCGDDPVAIGDAVTLFGPGTAGEPTAREWAEVTGTIDYEIVTRIGSRVPRRPSGAPGGES
ncbi:alanine racemase [Nakamurella flavida]|uniref:Alanine racemase n=1 Tax=Nakamurella flavida TaxID=363630 RepID=A0A938YS54_9ACTN|nr:alanine racemase [Nakamurella flavida]MBM9475903.1 alanine racemase [Nakamurella flavida]MBM9478437.1 alanine racemase [Nakamurella flavida]MDP9777811.1 alanine racemase [Nakamurella flavida]